PRGVLPRPVPAVGGEAVCRSESAFYAPANLVRSTSDRLPEAVMRAWILGLFATAVLTSAGAALAATKLAPKDIQATFFNGQPFTASTLSNVKFKMIFTPEGKMTREPVGKAGVKADGTWKLSKDGFCTTWKGSKASCFTITTNNDEKWSVMRGSTVVAVWTK